MVCSLCGAKNSPRARLCEVCDSRLGEEERAAYEEENVVLETEEVGSVEVHKNRVLLALACLALLLTPWFWMSDLLTVPKEIKASRQAFLQFHQEYLANEGRWLEQKEQVLESMRRHRTNDDIGKQPLVFENIPLEVVYAFLRDDLNVASEQISLFPRMRDGELTVMLTKRESGIWPLEIWDSLEIVIDLESANFSPRFVRLRRGSRTVPEQLAFHYFEKELRQLAGLSSYQGGIFDLALFDNRANDSDQTTHVSWRYQQRGLSTRAGHIAADF